MCRNDRHEQSVRQWVYQIVIEVYRQQGHGFGAPVGS
jgi:hypothetical protein